jgi:hypothetical protein
VARFDLSRDNDSFALPGDPYVVVTFAATMKGATGLAQLVSDGLA